MSLREGPFRAVASGRKTVELRLYDPKRQLVQAGDAIRFTLAGGGESVTADVTEVRYFPDFEALYAALLPEVGAEGLGYAHGEVPDPAHMLDYYSPDAIARFGVVGIGIAVK
jgi:ASC-1-like (ASCH) protein